MQLSDCYYLGTITKTHGLQGDLVLHLDTDEPQAYQNLESLLLEQNGLVVPFFLSKAELVKKQQLRIRVQDVAEPETLIGKKAYLPLNSLPPLQGNNFYYHEVVDFEIFVDDVFVGQLKGVLENSAQDLFEIISPEGKQILIPVIDEWLTRVDRAGKRIYLSVPDGLLEVFS